MAITKVDTAKLTAQELAQFEAHGLTLRYANVESEADLGRLPRNDATPDKNVSAALQALGLNETDVEQARAVGLELAYAGCNTSVEAAAVTRRLALRRK